MPHKSNFTTEEFKYIDINIKNSDDHLHKGFFKNRKVGIDPEEIVEELFEGKTAQQQIYCLYSAIIDGDKRIVEAILECGDPDIFNQRIITKIFDTIIDIAEQQEPDQKELLKNRAIKFAKAAGAEFLIK